MSALYLSEHEKTALRAVDLRKLEELVDEALAREHITALYGLQLSECGEYVGNQMRAFGRALDEYSKSKAAKKREDLRGRAWLAARDVASAVREMLERADKEDSERKLFSIDDMIRSPYRFSDHIEIRVNFDWRAKLEDPLNFGSITFVYDVDTRPDYMLPIHQPKRKPTAAKVEDEQQKKLYREWDHLRMLAINAVREFLQKGGDAATIPERFVVTTSARDRYLNNFSCDFWQKPMLHN
jgi:hypothetical protein